MAAFHEVGAANDRAQLEVELSGEILQSLSAVLAEVHREGQRAMGVDAGGVVSDFGRLPKDVLQRKMRSIGEIPAVSDGIETEFHGPS